MGNRNKEDDRIEKAIRSLMKLPENRRCMNCNNLGPQYVCTTFATFVCMNCSGIHREFTHRVKSVSVAKFTIEEVTALRAGGNERARQVYFRKWDLQRRTFPDSSNLNKLRDFIKQVYVDRKYTGEKSGTAPPRPIPAEEMNDKPYAGRLGKSDELPGGSHHHSSHPKNPQLLSVVHQWRGSQRRNPVRFEVVDDRIRDGISGSRRPSYANVAAHPERSGLPAVRPLQEILGLNFPTLQISEASKESSTESAARSQESAAAKPAETKIETALSLIDFDTETEPTNAVSTSSLGSWAPLENQSLSKVNTLESLLFGLSVPSENVANIALQPPLLLLDCVPHRPSDDDDLLQATSSGSCTADVEATGSSSFPQLTASVGAQGNEPSFVSLVHDELGSSSVLPEQPCQAESRPVQEETKSNSRMELPMDLFTGNYPLMAAPVYGWQTGPPRGTGFNYYHNTMPVPAFPNQAKSTNPFDICGDERSQFPSMAPLHNSSIGTHSLQYPSPYYGPTFSPGMYMGQEMHNNIQLHPVRSPQGFGGPMVNTATTYSEHANPNSSSMGGNPFG